MNKWAYWAKCALIRAIKSMAETAIGMIGASAILSEVNWILVLSSTGLSGIVSILVSLKGLPEVEKEETIYKIKAGESI